LNELARRVRRRGLLRALAEGSAPPKHQHIRLSGSGQPLPAAAAPPPAPVEPDPAVTTEIPLDPIIAERLSGCTLSCAAVVTGLADLPAVERAGRVTEVSLLRLQVRRPEGDAELCVRQHVPPEIRGVVEPGSGLMVLAHENERAVAVVDWAATGEWIGATLSFPRAVEQYDWPPPDEWPAAGSIEVHDVDGLRARLAERRGAWILASADLVSLTPLRSRVDRRDEWSLSLQLRDGRTIQIKDRVPLLALSRLQAGNGSRAGTPIDVLVSSDGELAVDWEATLRQPELRRRR
jgi:hypothetical protein